MEGNEIKSLSDCIWTTRIARINTEKRLVTKEDFCQFFNVYYSFFTIVFSIWAYCYQDSKLSLLTIFMSIFLLVGILYLNSQRYIEKAREYRRNYTDLQRLEFKLKHILPFEIDKIRSVENEYCQLLDSVCNHTTFDYYCALHDSRGEYREQRYTISIKIKYWWGIIWRKLLIILLLILPGILYKLVSYLE